MTFSFGQAELKYLGSSWETPVLRGLNQCFLDLNVCWELAGISLKCKSDANRIGGGA